MASDVTSGPGGMSGAAAQPGFGPEAPLTPAGLQHRRTLRARRVLVVMLNLASLTALAAGIAGVVGGGGFAVSDWVILACFLVGAPWTVMGVWNALIGLWLLHGGRGGLALVAPQMAAGDAEVSVSTRVAVAMTVRNEDPAGAFAKLAEIRRGLDETGYGHLFDLFILSDTMDPAIAAREEELFASMRPALGGKHAVYRRRRHNAGFKAGNVREFLMKEGRDYPLFLPLDSDSLMSGDTILRMVRIMEAYPRIGILQSLGVGMPARSLFARIFQFGMRQGMRSYTMGAAWWQGDCGPYWGHNALIRTAPFRRHCRLPVLPGGPPLGGHILSHDQIEAGLMRRAGWEVRVLPVESGSWEENPPTLMDFTRRDLRWCQGNMQYLRLFGLRRLEPVSRFQLFSAIMMYFGAPAWMLMTLAALSKLWATEAGDINLTLGIAMFFIMFAVSLVPKLAGMADVLLTRGGTARYGGTPRFLAGCLVETIFTVMLAPVVALRVTLFLIGLAFGHSVIWGGQNRDAYRLGWREAVRGLWPQTLAGAGITLAILWMMGPGTLVWALTMVLGLTLSIPFAVLTASPTLGSLAARTGLCATPEEIAPPPAIARLGCGSHLLLPPSLRSAA